MSAIATVDDAIAWLSKHDGNVSWHDDGCCYIEWRRAQDGLWVGVHYRKSGDAPNFSENLIEAVRAALGKDGSQ